ncbi:hypothetical protein BHE74_00059482 [Ensete ventricosum]|nr:hypothetical protein BHE74_00059482 [Ensete ventricosum]
MAAVDGFSQSAVVEEISLAKQQPIPTSPGFLTVPLTVYPFCNRSFTSQEAMKPPAPVTHTVWPLPASSRGASTGMLTAARGRETRSMSRRVWQERRGTVGGLGEAGERKGNEAVPAFIGQERMCEKRMDTVRRGGVLGGKIEKQAPCHPQGKRQLCV